MLRITEGSSISAPSPQILWVSKCKCLPWGAATGEQHRQITKNGLVLTSCPASCEKLQEDEVRRGFGGDQITPSSLLQILGHEASFSRSDRKRHGGVLHWTVRLLEVIKVKLRDLPPTSLSNEHRCDRVLLCMENKKLSDVNFQPTKFINLVVQNLVGCSYWASAMSRTSICI